MREYLKRIPAVNGIPAEILLTALAYAESPGLPISLWRVGVQALGAGDVSAAALKKFARSKAASFVIESTGVDNDAEYRLFHQALNDALVNHADRRDDERALTQAFMALGQQSGWNGVLSTCSAPSPVTPPVPNW